MKTFKFSLVLRTREYTDVFITLDDNIYGIHSKRVDIYSYGVNTINIFIECNKNISIFTSKHFNVFITQNKIFMVDPLFTEKKEANFLFI